MKIKGVCKQIDTIATQIELGIKPSNSELSSVKGKIHYILRLNKGAGRFLIKRLNKYL